jgi:GNAT superfamily N-acetyltransferase
VISTISSGCRPRGRRLLAELEDQARTRGARRTRLETNGALREAISLHRSSGYAEVAAFNDEPYAHHWFEKRLQPPPADPHRIGQCIR